jgi:hypothetical protein
VQLDLLQPPPHILTHFSPAAQSKRITKNYTEDFCVKVVLLFVKSQLSILGVIYFTSQSVKGRRQVPKKIKYQNNETQ